jgi:hypothetical protein
MGCTLGRPVLADFHTRRDNNPDRNPAHCDVSTVGDYDLHLIPAETAALVGIAVDFIASYRAKLIEAVLELDEFIEAGVPKTELIGVALLHFDSPNGSRTGMIPGMSST